MSHRFVSAHKAISSVKSNQKIFIHGGAMTPVVLTNALLECASELDHIELMHLHTEGEAPYGSEKYKGMFHTNSFFVAGNLRQYVNEENADYIPICLSEAHLLFKRSGLQPDIALLQVSPPDKKGYCTLGASLDIVLDAISHAKMIIAEVNVQAPVTNGSARIHIDRFNYLVKTDHPLFTHSLPDVSANAKKIGQYISSLIEDGSTLQLGIGVIPDAVLKSLIHHKDLGIHTEMFSDGIIPLVETGVINGNRKRISRGKITTSFVLGTKKVYNFIHRNKMVEMRGASHTNNPDVIRMNPKVVSINSAIEVDLTGQVCAESIGTYQFSGVGGQLDFVRAATLSDGGKAIIAMESTTLKGESKIVPVLQEGAGVTTPRSLVHYVVTEYGIVDLFGKNLRERAKALIEIAHPDHQEQLYQSASERFNHL